MTDRLPVNWPEIEARYVVYGDTPQQLEQIYAISAKTIRNRASEEGWLDKRKKSEQKTSAISIGDCEKAILPLKSKWLEEVCAIAFSDIADLLEYSASTGLKLKDFQAMLPEARRTIKSIKEKRNALEAGGDYEDNQLFETQTEIKREDKLKALDMLARHFRLYAQKDEPTNTEAAGSPVYQSIYTTDQFDAAPTGNYASKAILPVAGGDSGETERQDDRSDREADRILLDES